MTKKPPRIPVTFKEEEMDLYNWLIKKSCRAGFIKDILYKVMKDEESSKK